MSSGFRLEDTLSDDIDYNACLDPSDIAQIFKEASIDVIKPQSKNKLTESDNLKATRMAKSATGTIDNYFREKIEVTENGKTFSVKKFDAIILVLYAKALTGDQRALTALIRYSKFGRKEPEAKRRVIAVYEMEDGIYIHES